MSSMIVDIVIYANPLGNEPLCSERRQGVCVCVYVWSSVCDSVAAQMASMFLARGTANASKSDLFLTTNIGQNSTKPLQ
jgi:hypothetical protein